MPRISRKEINSRYIHVMTQGIKKEYIFYKDRYKKYYLYLLKQNIRKCEKTKLLAYCIMNNHAHLLIYTEDIEELSKVMSKTNTSYGIYYNKRENRVGYVFRNRYNTQEIVDELHLYNAFVYIHNNPVKAGLVNELGDYKYSSYNLYKRKKVDHLIVKLIFNDESYMSFFDHIHKNFKGNNFIEVKEEGNQDDKVKTIIKDFCESYNISLEIIRKNNYFIELLVEKINDNCDVTNKKITELLGIGKNRISNIKKINKD